VRLETQMAQGIHNDTEGEREEAKRKEPAINTIKKTAADACRCVGDYRRVCVIFFSLGL
jgi:hypothetical protein